MPVSAEIHAAAVVDPFGAVQEGAVHHGDVPPLGRDERIGEHARQPIRARHGHRVRPHAGDRRVAVLDCVVERPAVYAQAEAVRKARHTHAQRQRLPARVNANAPALLLD